MPSTLRFHRVLRATPAKVYRAFLDPEAKVKWLPPHAADFEVLDEGAQALIELGAVIAHESEVLAMAVPAAIAERHATHPGFHQTASGEQLVVDGRGPVVLELIRLAVAVAVAGLLAFLR